MVLSGDFSTPTRRPSLPLAPTAAPQLAREGRTASRGSSLESASRLQRRVSFSNVISVESPDEPPRTVARTLSLPLETPVKGILRLSPHNLRRASYNGSCTQLFAPVDLIVAEGDDSGAILGGEGASFKNLRQRPPTPPRGGAARSMSPEGGVPRIEAWTPAPQVQERRCVPALPHWG